MPSTKRNALRMIRGKGDAAVTRYSCGVVEQAKEHGVNIIVTRRTKSGKIMETETKPRMVHRRNLLEVYGDTHELAGQGKYISTAALRNGRQIVVGAQHVNPYLRDNGVYFTIVEVFKKSIGNKVMSKLKARVASSCIQGVHLLWMGRRTPDGYCPGAASEWLTAEEVWERALEINPELIKILRKSKSHRRSVKTHKSPKEKFMIDLDVLCRATCIVDVSTGEREWRSDATPYSKPLEQCGFAIDKRYLTYDVDENGNEVAQDYYRMVIGRSEPHTLPRTSWAYEGVRSSVAFLNDKVRQKLIAARS